MEEMEETAAVEDDFPPLNEPFKHFRQWGQTRITAAKMMLLKESHPGRVPDRYWENTTDPGVRLFESYLLWPYVAEF